MIGGCRTSLLEGVVVVVVGPFGIGLLNPLFSLLLADVMGRTEAMDAVGHGGGDEEVDTTGMVAQDIVCTASNEEGRLLLRQATDDIALHLEEGIVAEAVF